MLVPRHYVMGKNGFSLVIIISMEMLIDDGDARGKLQIIAVRDVIAFD